ncbi:ribosomal-protein-alanine N-acetyltransferase [Paenibacillus sp. 1_12]|uniref:GNAT family N-acetyltransferase n=1 Tax=Paenibacillus sp. 1_12 TaxID=1566278 RepID=UPI0008E4627C|nr:GNAT family N-acetyltransferase [Paenibacillus sp. 1_12]SFK83194.1 ribosomal-protein-alanine N-acetyltransferase [Paenibacillus sp. 1_12]
MHSELSVMRLETERLVIRPYIESDLMESFELMQNPELFRYMDLSVLPLEAYKGLFNWLMNSYNTPFDKSFKYSFAIRSKGTGAFIGWCGVGVLDFSAPDKELYYLIGRDYWGNGYATEAANAMSAYAFDIIGLDRLYAKADIRNAASLRIFEKLGFVFDRVLSGLTGDYKDCNGELLHVLTKERFIERKVI